MEKKIEDEYPNKYEEKEIERWHWRNKLCGVEIKYRCYEDCRQAGCPGHKFTGELHSVTDTIVVNFGDGGRDIYLDPTRISLLMHYFKLLSD